MPIITLILKRSLSGSKIYGRLKIVFFSIINSNGRFYLKIGGPKFPSIMIVISVVILSPRGKVPLIVSFKVCFNSVK